MRIVVVENGASTELEFPGGSVRVGRALDNDVRLTNALVSRHHCLLERDAEGTWVVDLDSANGTQLNGERIRQRELLAAGDEVAVGSAQLRLLAPELPEEEAGSATLLGDTGDGELAVFARITRALIAETELSPLLRLIVDSAVQLVSAERGFVLLSRGAADDEAAGSEEVTRRLEPSELRVRVARLYDASDIPVPSSRLSQGIAEQVFRTGRGVLSVDASRDERFTGMASVEDLKLRSVLCVPVATAGRVEGVLYVDNRLQRGAFRQSDLALLDQLADLASLAITNAHLVAELRERNRRLLASSHQIRQLNERLGRKVRDRDTELAVVRAELGRERGRYDYTAIVGASDGMRRVFQKLDRIVETELPVLITGESGTGKELIARAIHYNGPRKERAFIGENCAALPDTLLESELFGHARGAFTGADRAKKGLVEQANGGTLFLDEIGDMSPAMQKKLLRVLQEGEVRPLGSDQRVPVDVRLLAASHRNLAELVKSGEFREDLFYRINVLDVELPPLRARKEDIPLLAEALLARAAREAGRPVPHLPHEVVAALTAYDWPGNVRELENEMRRLVVLVEERVELNQLSDTVLSAAPEGAAAAAGAAPEVAGDLRAAVASFERRAILEALERVDGNKSRAAAELGISRFALQRKLDKYGLGPERAEEGE